MALLCIYGSSGHMQCDIFFPLQNSMFSKGCVQVHVPSATNISTFRTTSFCSPRQAAFSALWLSPLLQTQNNNARLSEHFRAFYFDAQYKFAVLGHTKDYYKPY